VNAGEETVGLNHFLCGGSSQVTLLTLYSVIIPSLISRILHRDRKGTEGFREVREVHITAKYVTNTI